MSSKMCTCCCSDSHRVTCVPYQQPEAAFWGGADVAASETSETSGQLLVLAWWASLLMRNTMNCRCSNDYYTRSHSMLVPMFSSGQRSPAVGCLHPTRLVQPPEQHCISPAMQVHTCNTMLRVDGRPCNAQSIVICLPDRVALLSGV